MLVNADEIMAIMKAVPKGRLITIVEICRQIAGKHHVQGCCSLTTGIYIMTIANAVEEAAREGKSIAVPYWRNLKSEGSLNEKFPGGLDGHKRLLQKEGFIVLNKGKRYFVENFQEYLYSSNSFSRI